MAYIKPRFIWLFCSLFVYTILCLTRCWALDLFDDSSSKGITLRHDIKVPIGTINNEVRHIFLSAGTFIKEIPEMVSQQRLALGLPAEILLSEQTRFFQEFSWKIRRNQFVKSPIPGKVVKVYVREGNSVEVGDRLSVMEAMKMEFTLRSFLQGTIKSIFCDKGRIIANGSILISLLPHSTKWETIDPNHTPHQWVLLASFFPWITTTPPENSPPDTPKGTFSPLQEKDLEHNHKSLSPSSGQNKIGQSTNNSKSSLSDINGVIAPKLSSSNTLLEKETLEKSEASLTRTVEEPNLQLFALLPVQHEELLEESLAFAEPSSERKGPVQQHESVSLPSEQALPCQSIQVTRADFTLIQNAHGFHIQPNNKSSFTAANPFQGSTLFLKVPREKQTNLKRSLEFLLNQEEIIVDSYRESPKSRSTSPLFTLDKLVILGLMLFGKLLLMFKTGPLAKISYLTYLFPHAASYNAFPLANIKQLNASCFNQYSLISNKILSNTNAPPLTRTKVAHLQRR